MCFMLGLTKEFSLEKIKSPREKRLFFFYKHNGRRMSAI